MLGVNPALTVVLLRPVPGVRPEEFELRPKLGRLSTNLRGFGQMRSGNKHVSRILEGADLPRPQLVLTLSAFGMHLGNVLSLFFGVTKSHMLPSSEKGAKGTTHPERGNKSSKGGLVLLTCAESYWTPLQVWAAEDGRCRPICRAIVEHPPGL